MRIQLAPGFKNTGKNTIGKDVLAGLILMAVSIPISMHRSRDCRQYVACMVLCSRFFYLPCFPHHRSLSLEWMRLRRHW